MPYTRGKSCETVEPHAGKTPAGIQLVVHLQLRLHTRLTTHKGAALPATVLTEGTVQNQNCID